MPGHRHPTKRCDTCEFWARGDQYTFEPDDHPDEQIAACHRHAPRSSLGDFEYELLNLLSIIAWEVGDKGEKNERNHGNWEEAYLGDVVLAWHEWERLVW